MASWKLSLEYRTELFNPERMKRLLQHYRTLLEGIAVSVEPRISELEMLSELEEQQLLVGWNRTEAPDSSNKCVHQLFEEQAAKSTAGRGGGRGRSRDQLRGAEPASESVGSLPGENGRRAGGSSRYLFRAEPGDGGRSDGYSEGRRSLCAVGPGRSQRTAKLHGQGCRGQDCTNQ